MSPYRVLWSKPDHPDQGFFQQVDAESRDSAVWQAGQAAEQGSQLVEVAESQAPQQQ